MLATRRSFLTAPAILAFHRLSSHRALAEALVPPADLAVPRVAAHGNVPLSRRLTQKPLSQLSKAYAPLCYASLWAFDAPFDAVRFVYANAVASPIGFKAAVACSANQNDGFTPTGGGAFRAVTVNALAVSGLRSLQSPADSSAEPGGATAGTLPPGPGVPSTGYVPAAQVVPALCATDWMPVSPITPVDGAAWWLMARTRIETPGYLGHEVPNAANYRTMPGAVRSWFSAADGVATPGAFVAGAVTERPGAILPTAVEVISRQPGLSFMTVGDSLDVGLYTASGVDGWGGILARSLSTARLPVTWIDNGWSGQTSANYIANGRNAIEAHAPKLISIKPWSANDNEGRGPTMTSIEQSLRAAMALGAVQVAQGGRFLLETAEPWHFAGEREAARQWLNASLQALAAGGLPVADMDLALRDPAAPSRALPAYVAGTDGLHFNDAGQAAKAAAALPLVSRMLGLA